jgi:hypothetical protein
MTTKAKHIAVEIDRIQRLEFANPEYRKAVQAELEDFIKSELPSGSGIDAGCTLLPSPNPGKEFCIKVPYHHMDNGMYCGWQDYKVRVTSDLRFGFTVRVTSTKRSPGITSFMVSDTKEYLGELFWEVLSECID